MKTFFEVAFEILGCAVLQESYRHLIDKEKENDIRRIVKNV